MKPVISGKITFRQIEQTDGPLVAELIEQSPDTGTINFAPNYKIDPIQSFNINQEEYFGIVAQSSDSDSLAGMCLTSVQQVQYNEKICNSSYINSLVVHPLFRKQGIASKLVRQIVDYSYQKLGNDCLIWAAIQAGNIGSELTVGKFLGEKSLRKILNLTFKPLARNTQSNHKFFVRSLEKEDYPSVIESMNAFYRSWNFYHPATISSFGSWINKTPFPDNFRHCLIVKDITGQIVSGALISEEFRLRELKITGIPAYLHLLNAIFHILPKNGVMKIVSVNKLWFLPGFEDAARYLWSEIRWRWRNDASSILISADTKSPILDIVNPPAWLPKTVVLLLINGDDPVDQDKLVYF